MWTKLPWFITLFVAILTNILIFQVKTYSICIVLKEHSKSETKTKQQEKDKDTSTETDKKIDEINLDYLSLLLWDRVIHFMGIWGRQEMKEKLGIEGTAKWDCGIISSVIEWKGNQMGSVRVPWYFFCTGLAREPLRYSF